MTAARSVKQAHTPARHRGLPVSCAGGAGARRDGPVIVLAYPHAGAGRLRSLLAQCPELACTPGTGLLPLCEQAMTTWQQAEDRDRPPSTLALASIRALAGSVIFVVLAREGRPRWCEVATAATSCAEAFLKVFPGARFLCLHRNCGDVTRSATAENPSGPSGHELGPFAAAYPGCPAAALAAYWAARTESLLEFEAAHPGACHRVRYEDLADDHDRTLDAMATFLGLCHPGQPAPHGAGDDDGQCAPDWPSPAGQIPLPLLSHVNKLQARLSYAPLPPGGGTPRLARTGGTTQPA